MNGKEDQVKTEGAVMLKEGSDQTPKPTRSTKTKIKSLKRWICKKKKLRDKRDLLGRIDQISSDHDLGVIRMQFYQIIFI